MQDQPWSSQWLAQLLTQLYLLIMELVAAATGLLLLLLLHLQSVEEFLIAIVLLLPPLLVKVKSAPVVECLDLEQGRLY